MSKLPAVAAQDVFRVAQRLGFAFDRQRGSHVVYLRAADKCRLVIPVHKGRDLKPGTPGAAGARYERTLFPVSRTPLLCCP